LCCSFWRVARVRPRPVRVHRAEVEQRHRVHHGSGAPGTAVRRRAELVQRVVRVQGQIRVEAGGRRQRHCRRHAAVQSQRTVRGRALVDHRRHRLYAAVRGEQGYILGAQVRGGSRIRSGGRQGSLEVAKF